MDIKVNNLSSEPIENKLLAGDGAAVPCYSRNNLIEQICRLTAVVLCLLTVFTYFSSFENGEDQNYPLEQSVTAYDPYIQQFDAFMKGQLNIDYEPSDVFLSIENPYDPAQREGVFFLYDRAYFEGKYYSYFGTTPIFTVIYPYYLFTGTVPRAATIQLVFMSIFAVFMPLVVFLLGKKLFSGISPILYSIISYVAFVSSLQMLFARGRSPFYYIAATSALAFLSMFAYLFFKGVFAEKCKTRCFWFLFAGLAFALCFHSRINTAFTAAFFIVPVVIFSVILKKRTPAEGADAGGVIGFCRKYRVADIAYELSSLALFVVVGFVLVFIYNHARFGSILDFGSNYQLTIADVSTYELNVSEIWYALFHYFIAPIAENAETGALNFGYARISTIGRYLYIDAHFGIYMIPFMLLSLLFPFISADSSKNVILRTSVASAFVGCVVIAWVDFCMGGVIYRYLCDFSAILAVISALCAFALLEKISSLRLPVLKNVLICVFVLFCVFSVYQTFRIMALTNGNVMEMDPESLFFKLFGTPTVS